ncbi:glycosyltransferase [Micromonospora sp. STR1s_5]|nr:glycosyltransferase [Micromonospora sp. STR1s_5]
MEFAVHGTTASSFGGRFSSAVEEAVRCLGRRITFFGQYQPHEVNQLMRQSGWVVVPSKWWENSPLVIQEALVSGRPVIVSDIGGMREKIVDGVTGLHFPAGSHASLGRLMSSVAGDSRLWRSLRSHAVVPPSVAEMNARLLTFTKRNSAVRSESKDQGGA